MKSEKNTVHGQEQFFYLLAVHQYLIEKDYIITFDCDLTSAGSLASYRH